MRVTLLFALLLAACTSESEAMRALQAGGYRDIQITGYRVFGCGDGDDVFHTGFVAKGQNGQQVSGVVCSGWLKGATIRTD